MIDPIPPSRAWTGTVTAYVSLITEGEASVNDGRRQVPTGPGNGDAEWEGEGYGDLVSPESARLDKARDMAGPDGGSDGGGRAASSARSAPPGGTGHREQGIVAHAMLEASDFASDMEAYRAMAGRVAESFGLALSDELKETLAARAWRFQEGPMGREVREAMEAGREVWREWPFWLRLEEDGEGRGPVVLSGVVDLFYVNSKGEGVVVDYKLFRPRDEEAYRRQVEIYVRALRSATGFAGNINGEIVYLSE
jgi:hypothetical protein